MSHSCSAWTGARPSSQPHSDTDADANADADADADADARAIGTRSSATLPKRAGPAAENRTGLPHEHL